MNKRSINISIFESTRHDTNTTRTRHDTNTTRTDTTRLDTHARHDTNTKRHEHDLATVSVL